MMLINDANAIICHCHPKWKIKITYDQPIKVQHPFSISLKLGNFLSFKKLLGKFIRSRPFDFPEMSTYHCSITSVVIWLQRWLVLGIITYNLHGTCKLLPFVFRRNWEVHKSSCVSSKMGRRVQNTSKMARANFEIDLSPLFTQPLHDFGVFHISPLWSFIPNPSKFV